MPHLQQDLDLNLDDYIAVPLVLLTLFFIYKSHFTIKKILRQKFQKIQFYFIISTFYQVIFKFTKATKSKVGESFNC